jgi:hypothetical protein
MGAPGVRSRPPLFGAAELGLAAVVVALAALAVTGTGLPRPTLAVAEPLVWVPDGERGELVQVDPLTGRVEARVRAGRPGEPLEVVEEGGRLAVSHHATGAVQMLDAGTLAPTGHRPAVAGGVRVLLAAADTFIVELGRGVVRRVDPATITDAGLPLETGRPIADAALGADGVLWLLMRDGGVERYVWATRTGEFEPTRIGRGPVALGDPDRSLVVVADGARSAEISVGANGCAQPWRPTIVGLLLIVACRGTGRVLVLSPDGRPAAPEITLPGTPQPVRYGGGLLLTAGERAVVVPEVGGAARALTLRDPGVAVHEPAAAG